VTSISALQEIPLRRVQQLPIKEIKYAARCRVMMTSRPVETHRLPMKKQLCLSFAVLSLAIALSAAPLMETTAIHPQPDANTPAIGYLKAGTEPLAAASATAPEGWIAVELPGPHEAYVSNNDFSKSLDVRPGAAIRQMPKADAAVITTMHDGDKVEITGLRTGWTQIKLSKNLVGYVRIGGAAPAPVAVASAMTAAPPPPVPATASLWTPISGSPPSALSRGYQGILVEAKRFLLIGPRPDFDYQLNDSAGKRIAFLNVSKVLATRKLELYLDHLVNVTGVLKQTYDGKNIVIEVESLDPR
jgi:hypothetical protein